MKNQIFKDILILSITGIFLISILVPVFYYSDLFAAGSQERDSFAPIFKGKTKSYSFPLKNIDTNDPLTVDTTKDVVYFKVKKNTSDATYAINKTCTYAKKFIHEGVVGTLAKNDSVTGATSGATAKIGYVNVLENKIWFTNVSGTFVDGEQVYKTSNTNYVILADSGIWLGITSLSTTDTNLDIGDYYAYVELYNSTEGYDEIILKSKYKVIQ